MTEGKLQSENSKLQNTDLAVDGVISTVLHFIINFALVETYIYLSHDSYSKR